MSSHDTQAEKSFLDYDLHLLVPSPKRLLPPDDSTIVTPLDEEFLREVLRHLPDKAKRELHKAAGDWATRPDVLAVFEQQRATHVVQEHEARLPSVSPLSYASFGGPPPPPLPPRDALAEVIGPLPGHLMDDFETQLIIARAIQIDAVCNKLRAIYVESTQAAATKTGVTTSSSSGTAIDSGSYEPKGKAQSINAKATGKRGRWISTDTGFIYVDDDNDPLIRYASTTLMTFGAMRAWIDAMESAKRANEISINLARKFQPGNNT